MVVADSECISRLCVRLKNREVLLTESFNDVSSSDGKVAVLDGGVVAAQPGRLQVPHRLRRSRDGFYSNNLLKYVVLDLWQPVQSIVLMAVSPNLSQIQTYHLTTALSSG